MAFEVRRMSRTNHASFAPNSCSCKSSFVQQHDNWAPCIIQWAVMGSANPMAGWPAAVPQQPLRSHSVWLSPAAAAPPCCMPAARHAPAHGQSTCRRRCSGAALLATRWQWCRCRAGWAPLLPGLCWLPCRQLVEGPPQASCPSAPRSAGHPLAGRHPPPPAALPLPQASSLASRGGAAWGSVAARGAGRGL